MALRGQKAFRGFKKRTPGHRVVAHERFTSHLRIAFLRKISIKLAQNATVSPLTAEVMR